MADAYSVGNNAENTVRMIRAGVIRCSLIFFHAIRVELVRWDRCKQRLKFSY